MLNCVPPDDLGPKFVEALHKFQNPEDFIDPLEFSVGPFNGLHASLEEILDTLLGAKSAWKEERARLISQYCEDGTVYLDGVAAETWSRVRPPSTKG